MVAVPLTPRPIFPLGIHLASQGSDAATPQRLQLPRSPNSRADNNNTPFAGGILFKSRWIPTSQLRTLGPSHKTPTRHKPKHHRAKLRHPAAAVQRDNAIIAQLVPIQRDAVIRSSHAKHRPCSRPATWQLSRTSALSSEAAGGATYSVGPDSCCNRQLQATAVFRSWLRREGVFLHGKSAPPY